jgi:hypothetical protein
VNCSTPEPMSSVLPISSAPRDGTLIRFWCPSETAPIVAVAQLHRLVGLPRGRAAHPPRRNRLGADRGPGRRARRAYREGPAAGCPCRRPALVVGL